MHSEAYSDKCNVSQFTLSTSVASFVFLTEVSFMLHLPREQPSSSVIATPELNHSQQYTATYAEKTKKNIKRTSLYLVFTNKSW